MFGTIAIQPSSARVVSREQSLAILAGTWYTVLPLGATAAAENVDDPPQPAVVTARSAAAVIARALAGKAGNPGASYNEACSVAGAASTSPAVKTNDEPAERPHTMIVSRSVAQSKSVV